MTDAEQDELLRRLRDVAEVADPVPAAVLGAARAAFTWRTIDDELATLTYDSWSEHRALAGVRGGGPRQLSFEGPDLAVDLQVEGQGGSVLGQLVPPTPGEVEIRHRGGTVTLAADELGRFAVGAVAPGPVKLRCRPAGSGTTTTTDWFVL